MLSIIVPVYNVEKYLNECLESVANQSSNNYEVIIVNDGSTDNCQKIIESFCQKYSHFQSFTKENGGLMSAYLYGIGKSKGDFIGFVDSDDFIDSNFVLKMYDQNKENADIVMCERIDIYDDGTITHHEKPIIDYGFYNNKNNKFVYENVLPKFVGRHLTNARWNKIFRREIVLENLKYCESKSRIMEDRFFTPSCMFTASTFKYIEDELYNYRQRSSGSNHSMASPKLYGAIKLLMKTQKQMFVDKNIYSQYQTNYELACLNYISLYVDRNLTIKQDFKTRYKYCSQIITDKEFKKLVLKYKKYLKYKKGFALKLCYSLNSSFLLSILTYKN